MNATDRGFYGGVYVGLIGGAVSTTDHPLIPQVRLGHVFRPIADTISVTMTHVRCGADRSQRERSFLCAILPNGAALQPADTCPNRGDEHQRGAKGVRRQRCGGSIRDDVRSHDPYRSEPGIGCFSTGPGWAGDRGGGDACWQHAPARCGWPGHRRSEGGGAPGGALPNPKQDR